MFQRGAEMSLRRSITLLAAGGLAFGVPVARGENADRAIARPQLIFEDWRAAMNSGSAPKIKAFYAANLGDDNPVFALENARDTCGFDLKHVEVNTSSAFSALLSQRCLPGKQRIRLELAADGTKLKTLDFRPLPLGGDRASPVTATIASRLASTNDFAGAVIVARGNKRLLARSWGAVETVNGGAITLDTPMFLASAGKMFTAVAVLQLVEAGRIELDKPLGAYLADYPNKDMAKGNIRQFLTHRGRTGDNGILGRDERAQPQRGR